MRRPVRNAFLLGVLVGLVAAIARALAGSRTRGPADPGALPHPTSALPARTPAAARPEPAVLVATADPPAGAGAAPVPAPTPDTAAPAPGADPGPARVRWVPPVDGACPDGHPLKANESSGLHHRPGGLSYERTRPDRCYATPADAEADGFRAAKR